MSDAEVDSAQRLIDHARGLAWERLPETSRQAAKTFFHDTLCVGAAGARAAHSDAVLEMARGWGGGTQASVMGRPAMRLAPPASAFVNAFQIHGQEFDCVHEAAVLHPMATVVAALLAEVQRGSPVTGAQLLTAIVAGVDVAVTLGLAATGPLKFFRPATAGLFGSVAAIASLRGMSREPALAAFGHALALVSGTMQAHVEGKPALALQVANAARCALIAVDLAKAGIPGVERPIDGLFGYLALFETSASAAPAIAMLGQGHRIEEVSAKPFPTGRAAHGGILAIQKLLAMGVSARQVSRLEFHVPPLVHRLVGRRAQKGMDAGYARLCLPWLAAVTLTRGAVAVGDFGLAMLANLSLQRLAGRVRVIADPNPDPAAFVPAVLVAYLSNDQRIEIAVDALLRAPQCPMSVDQYRAKARDCLDFVNLGRCEEPLAETVEHLPNNQMRWRRSARRE